VREGHPRDLIPHPRAAELSLPHHPRELAPILGAPEEVPHRADVQHVRHPLIGGGGAQAEPDAGPTGDGAKPCQDLRGDGAGEEGPAVGMAEAQRLQPDDARRRGSGARRGGEGHRGREVGVAGFREVSEGVLVPDAARRHEQVLQRAAEAQVQLPP